nr:RNA-directed DNA polymerase, eukaryota, reverse transcriptase zinc-binding domain protein [Tanacetum cinerariifolium]
DINRHKVITNGHSWAISGDFNVTLNSNEHFAGSSSITNDMMDFRDCINQVEVEDLSSAGLYFTWTKNLHKVKIGDYSGILKKLDRIMISEDFVTKYPQAHAIFMPYLISDHSPALLIIHNGMRSKEIFQLKLLKHPINNLNWSNGDLVEKVKVLKDDLMKIQTEIDADPHDKNLRDKGLNVPVSSIDACAKLFTTKLSPSEASQMVRPVNDSEIKKAMFSIADSKASGPDGFSAKIFKSTWHIVGPDVCSVVKEFFYSGKLLGELNATIISLIPKITTHLLVTDFRPIACCNVVYKCISKVITERIKGCLYKLINKNQSAFIPGILIQDSILLAQDLMQGYNRVGGPKRVTFKIDIQKAYDTVSWDFMEQLLEHFGLHEKMRNWIMVCIRTVKFSININGESCGFLMGNVKNNPEFNYHFRFKEMRITHICFVDDLLVLCHGDSGSVKVIKDTIEEFG